MGEDETLSTFFKEGSIVGGRYAIQKEIKQGGCGVVFLIFSKDLGIYCALKTMIIRPESEVLIRDWFKKEASIWINLPLHPNILRAYAIDEVSGRLCILTEFVNFNYRGINTLRGYLERCSPDLSQTIKWGVEICRGMEHANTNGIRCHRDLKPENILIDLDSTAKITDFGLSSEKICETANSQTEYRPPLLSQNNVTAGSGVLGTRLYMSPEHFLGGAYCDVRSDIFSFGIMLYEMASLGIHPFLKNEVGTADSQDDSDSIYRQKEGIYDPLTESPLSQVIEKCLAKSPDDRYQSFLDLRKDLEILYETLSGSKILYPKTKKPPYWDFLNRGSSLATLKRYSEAIGFFEEALRLEKRNPITWYSKGVCLAELGRYKESIDDFDQSIALDPTCSLAWSNKSLAVRHLGDFDEALGCANEAIRLDRRNGHAWISKGLVFNEKGMHNKAIECFKVALEVDPSDSFALHNLGVSLTKNGDYEGALVYFDILLKLDLSNGNTWLHKANCHYAQGNKQESLSCYEKATIYAEENTYIWRDSWNNKGIYHQESGEYPEAVKCYKSALTKFPYDYTVLINLANTYFNNGDYSDALTCYDTLSKQDPSNYYIWKMSGLCFRHLGKFPKAIEYLEKSLGLNSQITDEEKAWIIEEIALCLIGLGKPIEAMEKFDEAIALDPKNWRFLLNKGKFLYDSNKTDHAIVCANRAIALNNTYAEAYHLKGVALVNLGDIENGMKCISKASELSSNNTQYQREKGHCHRMLGEYLKAIAIYTIILSKTPSDSDLIMLIGMCFAALGDSDSARKYFDRAFRINIKSGNSF